MDLETKNQSTKSSPQNRTNDLVDSVAIVKLSDDQEESDDIPDKRNIEQLARRLVIYLRPQMLKLSKSPLVKPPDGMPTLKDWFG
jgi:hypothetical protein